MDAEKMKGYMVTRQGKTFILYKGLLALCHEAGLQKIATELIQIPAEENNRTAICKATVVLQQEGKTAIFEGIGDAAPNNVAPAMQTCLIRMSETRAKARAMRDAVNCGEAALEELAPDNPSEEANNAQAYQNPPASVSRRTEASRGQGREDGREEEEEAAYAVHSDVTGSDGVVADRMKKAAAERFWLTARAFGIKSGDYTKEERHEWYARLLGTTLAETARMTAGQFNAMADLLYKVSLAYRDTGPINVDNLLTLAAELATKRTGHTWVFNNLLELRSGAWKALAEHLSEGEKVA